MPPDQHEDPEWSAIKPQQSVYELDHFDKRDQEFLTRLSIVSQQCNLLRLRNSSLAAELREEIRLLKLDNSTLRSELAPLQAMRQKMTSTYAVLAALGAVALAILEAVNGLRKLFGGK